MYTNPSLLYFNKYHFSIFASFLDLITKQFLPIFLHQISLAMELYQLACLITMQKTSSRSKQSSSVLLNIILVLLEMIFSRVDNVHKFFSRFWFSLQLQFGLGNLMVFKEESKKSQDSDSSNLQQRSNEEKDDRNNLRREQMEMVMERLGLFCSSESEELKEEMSSDELSQLFDDKEPSLDEVKAAFDVFDQNADGFIDAMELQRVLRKLGLKEEHDSCRKMIRKYDENKDGRIDFNEFMRFMETNF